MDWTLVVTAVKLAGENILKSGKMTRFVLALCLLSVPTMAVIDYLSYREQALWREGEPERGEKALEDLTQFQITLVDKMVEAFRAEDERDQKQRLLDRIARQRPLIADCPRIPPHILSDLHDVPRYFGDDEEVMRAYELLVTEGSQLDRRGRRTEALFQAMARATNTTDLFPPTPTFAREFTVECW